MSKLPFKELIVWQKSMELGKQVYELSKKFPKEELYGLTSQMRRSVLSVPSNIAEGSQRGSDKDFANFLRIAKGSLAELQTQLLFSVYIHYLSDSEIEQSLSLIEEIDKMLFALHKKLLAPR